MILKRLRFFSYACIFLSCLTFIAEIYARSKGIEYFFGIYFIVFLLAGSGMELVRRELENHFKISHSDTFKQNN